MIEPVQVDYNKEKVQALTYLNHLRQASGLIPLDLALPLEKAAQNHARYLIVNYRLSHNEIKSHKAFTGVTPSARAAYAGYKSAFVIENISCGSKNYKDSVDHLLAAIYHRFAFLDFNIDEIGIGILQNSTHRSKIAHVYDMGLSMINTLCHGNSFTGKGKYVFSICGDKKFRIQERRFNYVKINTALRSSEIIIYPFDGQKDVPAAFFDEIPDPLPDHRVSGYPISISFNEAYYKNIELETFELYDNIGNKIENTLFFDHLSDPNEKLTKFEYALLPLERLEWNMRYHVKVKYVADGKKEEKRWSFFTKRFEEKLYTVTPENHTFRIPKNTSTIFYIKPLDQKDIIEYIYFPDYMHIKYIDQNTIRMIVTDKAPNNIELKLGKQKLKLYIE
jgi:hypothetical protein